MTFQTSVLSILLMQIFCRTIKKYDYIIGNLSFDKMKTSDPMLSIYRKNAINTHTTNIDSFFLNKALGIANLLH